MPRDTPAIFIAGRRLASDVPPFVIAEIRINADECDVPVGLFDHGVDTFAPACEMR